MIGVIRFELLMTDFRFFLLIINEIADISIIKVIADVSIKNCFSLFLFLFGYPKVIQSKDDNDE